MPDLSHREEDYSLTHEQVLDLLESMAKDANHYERQAREEKDSFEKDYAYAKADGIRHAWSNLTLAVRRAQDKVGVEH